MQRGLLWQMFEKAIPSHSNKLLRAGVPSQANFVATKKSFASFAQSFAMPQFAARWCEGHGLCTACFDCISECVQR